MPSGVKASLDTGAGYRLDSSKAFCTAGPVKDMVSPVYSGTAADTVYDLARRSPNLMRNSFSKPWQGADPFPSSTPRHRLTAIPGTKRDWVSTFAIRFRSTCLRPASSLPSTLLVPLQILYSGPLLTLPDSDHYSKDLMWVREAPSEQTWA